MDDPKDSAVHVQAETFVCPNCGGVMRFDINKQLFACSSCKTEGAIESLVDTVKEYDFNSYHEREKKTVPFVGMAVVCCQNCGAEITLENKQTAGACPMCGSTHIANAPQRAGIPPEGVVPFKIDKNNAQDRFRKWVKSRWFAPNNFKKSYGEGLLKGMYLPFWTFDADTVAYYSGQGGVIKTKTNSKGETETYTEWYPVSGIVSRFFDDIQVCASDKDAYINNILPFDTKDSIKPFSAAYLSGYYAEVYTIKADEGFRQAKTTMESQLRQLAEQDILMRYDTASVSSLNARYLNVTYKHVLLPVWASAFGYKGKVYNYVINGETGKVAGGRPYSIPKIAAAVIAAILALALVVLLTYDDAEASTLTAAYSSVEQHNAAGFDKFTFDKTETLNEWDIISGGETAEWPGLVKEKILLNGKNFETMFCFTNGPVKS